MTKRVAVGIVIGAGLFWASEARAQTAQGSGRAFLNVSGGIQTGSETVATAVSFPLYEETALVDASREVKSSPIWDVTGGLRVRKNFAVALSVSGRSATTDGALLASIPHPVFFDQPRTVAGSVSDMKHSELWTSLLFAWMYPVTDKIEVMAMAGPAVVFVQHEVVTGVTVTEGSGNVPTLTVQLESLEKSPWGVMAGVDGRYTITSKIGAGVFLRYTAAKANLTSETQLNVGGFQVGAGVRVKF